MRPLNKSRFLVACFLCSVAVASAQQIQSANTPTVVPRLLHFAGSFRPPVSQPAGTIGATFAIYSEQEGGTPLWTEDQNVELDANGNYTVLLGATKNAGVPPELFAGGEARWLQVKFYEPGEVDLPRVLLVSVPYALKAGDADTLGGKPASAYLLAGLYTSAQPSEAAQPAPSATAVAAKTGAAVMPAFTSTGTTNYVPEFTDTFGDIGNSVMYQNGSNIGVGTTAGAISMDIRPTATSPFAQLGVAQTVDYMTLFASDTYGPAFYWDPTKALRFGKGGTGLYNANGFTEYMRIQPNGYVGIGTLTPAATLEVNGNAQVDGNITLSGNLVASGSGGPLIQAPNNGSGNFSAGLTALPAGTTGTGNTAVGDQALSANTTGIDNVALGANALHANTTGGGGTAVGYLALAGNTTGAGNTAMGYAALQFNSTGSSNTAFGHGALNSNTTAGANTAVGNGALALNTTGAGNTATGYSALTANTTGASNTAVGDGALLSNTTAAANTAVGNGAMALNTTGASNTATGYFALTANTTGGSNTAVGDGALLANTTGGANTSVGFGALDNVSLTAGTGNTALGYGAGGNLTSGGENIYIVNAGVSSESGAIRIGTAPAQTSTYIAGIYGVNTSGIPVYINSNGQLGTVSSSRRYKEDIQDMADASSGLMRLRPVTFRYKKQFSDGSKPIQYGLIAEEVAEVYPDLVARTADGQIETVKYQVLDSMLLNELQKQKEQIRSLEERLAKLEAALEGTAATASSR
jgi:hypothetical protein